MTREEEIEQAAKAFDIQTISNPWTLFERGAEWADQHPHWISVEDDLPPRENEFHVSIEVLATDGETILKSFYDYDHECWVCFEGRWCFATVTHWIPLPQAPHIFRPQR